MSNTQIHLLYLILPTDTQRSSSSEVLEEAIGGSETIHLLVVPRTGTRTPQRASSIEKVAFNCFLSVKHRSTHCSALNQLKEKINSLIKGIANLTSGSSSNFLLDNSTTTTTVISQSKLLEERARVGRSERVVACVTYRPVRWGRCSLRSVRLSAMVV